MKGRRVSACLGSSAALGLIIAACGANSATPPAPASGHPDRYRYPVKVAARFPAGQRLGQRTDLKIDVTNTGARTIPDATVTLTNPRYGTSAQALETLIAARPPAGEQALGGRSRPVWMIDQPPGPCGYSCRNGGGAGGGYNADADTWALGSLAPGHTARFDWQLSALRAGRYGVAYRVAAGPDARAVLAGGAAATGSFTVKIASRPLQQRFTASGRIVSGNHG